MEVPPPDSTVSFAPTPVSQQPMTAGPVTESSPILGGASATPSAGDTILVLSPHARMGRQLSVWCSCAFLILFHGALLWIALTNGHLPCETNLAGFLTAVGVIGICSAAFYGMLEVKRGASDAAEATSVPGAYMRLAAIVLVLAALIASFVGFRLFSGASPHCATTSPVVYNWATAVLLLYGVFGGLVALVPVLSYALPVLSLALLPLLTTLYAFAQWTSEAGKRGATSALGLLARWLRGGSAGGSDVEAGSGGGTPLASPAAPFASYVNTAALVWLFGYMLVEVRREWAMPCDAPLSAFVLGIALVGGLLSVFDFVGGVFRNPMPPVTKEEHERARAERKAKLAALGWLGGAVLTWGALGLFWLGSSSTCYATSPAVYRLALLLGLVYAFLLALVVLGLLALAVDFCLSGKLRMVLILEQ